RIDKVESVAEALFDEWQQELQKYTNATLKRDSQRKLKDTQRRYQLTFRSILRIYSLVIYP
ncbi:DUF2959 family protein, partial [uncultured Paraglaciecola sp.]|uniref:DUF2959 family protein n=1 Tax=uncultured Paraglaciecola sp. TaxID=1765024 RepID=UPI0025DB34CF